MPPSRLILALLACLPASALAADSVPQVIAPLIHQIPDPWPWAARVDESAFEPGGAGVTIHAAPTGTAKGAGSAEDPLDLPSACTRLARTLQSVQQGAEPLTMPGGFPLWLRLSRSGTTLAFSVAADEQGRPATWIAAGTQAVDARDQRLAVGLVVCSGQGYPKPGQAAVASFDRLSISSDGSTFSPVNIGRTPRPEATITGSAESGFRLTGNGDSLRWMQPYGSGQVADHGQGYVAWVAGDFSSEVRITGLEAQGGVNAAILSFEARRSLDWKDDKAGLELAVTGTGPEQKTTLHRVWRRPTAQPGRPARLVLQPGTYRQALTLPDRDRIARRLPLVIAGALDQGRPGGVILSGDDSQGFEPATWRSDGEGNLSHEVPAAWRGRNPGKEVPILGITVVPATGEAWNMRSAKAKDGGLEPGTMRIDADGATVRMRLPPDIDAAEFTAAQVLVARRTAPLLGFGGANNRQDVGENLVIRNLVFQCVAGTAVALQDWLQPIDAARNILLEDLTFRWNTGRAFFINHLRDFTLRRLMTSQNLGGSWLIASEGVISDCTWQGNETAKGGAPGTFWNALRNVTATGCLFTGNDGAWRMDHIGENVVVDRCRFIGNHGRPAMIWETDIGPTTIRACVFERNQTTGDGTLALSTTHNVTIEGCSFVDNLPSAIVFYPRSRAHTAVKQYDDELCNNLDRGSWSARNTTAGRWAPGGVKPAAFVRNVLIHGCTFRADDPKATFINQERYRRPESYFRAIHQELRAWNNSYWNPAQPLAFLGASRVPAKRPEDGDGYPTKPIDFASWRTQSVHTDFEAGSVWGERIVEPVAAVSPAALTSGTDPRPQRSERGLTYSAEKLPFEATRAVFAWEQGGRRYHHLQADQVGEFGDRIDYTIDVPEAGTYTLVFDYLQNASPFRYLGFAQLLLDGEPLGHPIDQSGRTTQMISAPVATRAFTAGRHRLTVASVWRNGYTSADYDLTIGGFTLARQPPLRPAQGGAWAGSGLTLQTVSPLSALTLREVDWSRAQPGPLQPTVGVAVARPAAQRLDGLLRVPHAGLWRLSATVVGAMEVYLGGDLVIDSDGQHWGEKDDPWRKTVTLALAQGDHALRIDALVQTGRPLVELRWARPDAAADSEPEPVPAEVLGHAP